MNKKVVLLALTASLVLLCIFGSLFIVFVKAVPEGTRVEENYLSKQNFANLVNSGNQ